MRETVEQPSQLARQVHPALVLVVDDDLLARRVMCKFLKRHGFVIQEAGDGRQALLAYDQRRPDIVLLDIEMPVMDGYTTCRELRKRAGARQLPILMVSGNCDMAAVNRSQEEGANGFIPKPVSMAQLVVKIEELLHTGAGPA